MVSCSGFGLPLHAQLLRLFVTRHQHSLSFTPSTYFLLAGCRHAFRFYLCSLTHSMYITSRPSHTSFVYGGWIFVCPSLGLRRRCAAAATTPLRPPTHTAVLGTEFNPSRCSNAHMRHITHHLCCLQPPGTLLRMRPMQASNWGRMLLLPGTVGVVACLANHQVLQCCVAALIATGAIHLHMTASFQHSLLRPRCSCQVVGNGALREQAAQTIRCISPLPVLLSPMAEQPSTMPRASLVRFHFAAARKQLGA